MRRQLSAFLYAGILAATVVAAPAPADEVYNEFGLYTDLTADPSTASISVEPYNPFTVYLVVVNPYNFECSRSYYEDPYERPMDWVLGFACRILISDSSCIIAQAEVVTSAVRYGSPPDYFFVFNQSIPVPTHRRVHLMTLTMVTFDNAPKTVYLAPPEFFDDWESIHVFDGSPECELNLEVEACPSSGSCDSPVLGINQAVVATRAASWGDIKALFR